MHTKEPTDTLLRGDGITFRTHELTDIPGGHGISFVTCELTEALNPHLNSCIVYSAGLLSRQTQGRTIDPKPYNQLARSLRTSETLIHLRKKSPGFPELSCSRRTPLAKSQL